MYEKLHELITRKREASALADVSERTVALKKVQDEISALSDEELSTLEQIEEDYYWEDQSCQ